jgi:cellulose 1,4-beta-cellobiosidase
VLRRLRQDVPPRAIRRRPEFDPIERPALTERDMRSTSSLLRVQLAAISCAALIASACADDEASTQRDAGSAIGAGSGSPGGGSPGAAGAPGAAGGSAAGSGSAAGGTSAGVSGTTSAGGGSAAAGGASAGAGGASAGASAGAGGASAGSRDGGTGPGGGQSGTDAATPAATARVDNPYAGASGYVNPEWKMKASAEPGGERIANTPTAVWLDRIAAIEGTANSQSNGPMGVRDHLDAALAQNAGFIQFVIYNLPGRDCSALASNGELGTTELPRYKSEYIDAIAAIMGDAKYRPLRIINVIEVDSLPNLVTNTNVAKCAEMKSNGGYVQGVAYALQKLGALPNTYNYVDAGHHGWLGWDTNLGPSAELFAETARMAGMQNVHGFITNTANYSALREPFLDVNASVGGTPLRQAKWVDWNFYVDELSFAQAFRQKLISLGFDASIGMLIDTSRNGWGGAARPARASSATSVDTFVNESRIDRRVHAGNWCNQSGAGLGERPRASPEPGIDAYVWIKPPGESDGSSSLIQNSDGKGFDRMCDPTYGGNERNGNSTTGALANAPISGAWFAAQFQELMRNAYPAL